MRNSNRLESELLWFDCIKLNNVVDDAAALLITNIVEWMQRVKLQKHWILTELKSIFYPLWSKVIKTL